MKRTEGVSCSGTQLRAWIDSDCENMNGCCLPAVCAGVIHCKPDAPGALR